MFADVLIHIFGYLNNYLELSLVCKEWKSLVAKSRQSKIIQRLNQIETKISAKSQLINIAKDLATLFYHSDDTSKLIKLHDWTKKDIKIWWESDRASQYFSTETCFNRFFEIFDNIYQWNDDSNIISQIEPKTWKKIVKTIELPIFFSSKNDRSYYYSLIHKEHEQKLKQINKLIFPFKHVFDGSSDYFLGTIYDRLLKIDLKIIKKSCIKLTPLFNDEELLDMSLGYALGHVPRHDGEIGEVSSLKSWWVGYESDGRWFAMKLMTSIFDEKLIKHRIKLMKNNFDLKNFYFNHEFKCTIDLFMNLMKLTDESFQLLIDYKDIQWAKNDEWIVPMTMIDIPHGKLIKRFELISKGSKKGLKIEPSALEMNTSCLKRFIDRKLLEI